MKKKIICIILVLVVLGVLLSSCDMKFAPREVPEDIKKRVFDTVDYWLDKCNLNKEYDVDFEIISIEKTKELGSIVYEVDLRADIIIPNLSEEDLNVDFHSFLYKLYGDGRDVPESWKELCGKYEHGRFKGEDGNEYFIKKSTVYSDGSQYTSNDAVLGSKYPDTYIPEPIRLEGGYKYYERKILKDDEIIWTGESAVKAYNGSGSSGNGVDLDGNGIVEEDEWYGELEDYLNEHGY